MSPELWVTTLATLAFCWTNGFHDASNAIATAVTTRALTPRLAVVLAAVGNLVGGAIGLAVVTELASDLVVVTPEQAGAAVLSAFVVAIAWNLLTWARGMPSSSTHALLAALVGGALALGAVVHWVMVAERVLLPMLASPVLGLLVALGGSVALGRWLERRGGVGEGVCDTREAVDEELHPHHVDRLAARGECRRERGCVRPARLDAEPGRLDAVVECRIRRLPQPWQEADRELRHPTEDPDEGGGVLGELLDPDPGREVGTVGHPLDGAAQREADVVQPGGLDRRHEAVAPVGEQVTSRGVRRLLEGDEPLDDLRPLARRDGQQLGELGRTGGGEVGELTEELDASVVAGQEPQGHESSLSGGRAVTGQA